MSEIDTGFVFISYSPSKFGIKALSPGIIMGGYKLSNVITATAGFYGIGNEIFSEYSFLGGVAWAPGPYFQLGLSAEYLGINFKGFSSDAQLKLNLGGRIKLTDEIDAGVSLMNINRGHYEGGDETAVQTAVMGIGYDVIDNIELGINGIVRINSSSGFSINGKFNPLDDVGLLITYLSQPQMVSLGINWASADWISVSFMIYYHNYLGFVNNPGLSFYF
jgi:hypothetical protein